MTDDQEPEYSHELQVYFDVEAGSFMYGRVFSTPLEEHTVELAVVEARKLQESGKIIDWEIVS